jgi:hypothetical protein
MSLTEVLQGWEPLSYDCPSHLAKECFNKPKEDIMSLTRQEVFQALTEGKKIGLVPRLESCDWIGLHTYFKLLDDDVFESLNWCIEAEAEPLEWYENIPSHGVLCWVHNTIEHPNSSNSSLAVIRDLSIDGNYMDYLFNEWFYATPLTNEEIKQFLRGE